MSIFIGFRPPIAFHTNILTIFPGFQPWSLPKLARWAVENGFDGLEVGPAVPLKAEDFATARRIGATIFSLTYGRNVLAADRDERSLHQRNVLDRVRFAGDQGIPLVVLATGRAPGQSLRANLPAVIDWFGEQVLPLARQGGVTLAVENCPAVGNIATSPAMWDELFNKALTELTLGFDPSHLVWQFVDVYAALGDYAHKVTHVHVKDAVIDRTRLAVEGIDGEGWWRYTLPGWGELNWAAIIATLQRSGYRGCLSIEHEDAVWDRSEGQILQSLVLSRRYLEQFLGQPVEVPPVETVAPDKVAGVRPI
ncbi:MAG: sugar phosphate isomerase/epimerase [Caldilineaceae bacterium]|nr:sugar phosphate isomerase/epimerase [Caldilineaceae bacterium]